MSSQHNAVNRSFRKHLFILLTVALIAGRGVAFANNGQSDRVEKSETGKSMAVPQLVRPVLLHDSAGLRLIATSPTRKVFPEETFKRSPTGRGSTGPHRSPPRPGLTEADCLELGVVRNETEQVFLVVRPSEEMSGFSLDFADMDGPGTISASAWSYRRVAEVTVPDRGREPYALKGVHTGQIPDPLVPGKPFTARGERNTTLLLQVDVPGDVSAGEYEGRVVARAGGEKLATVPLRLTVWDVTLPEKRTMGTQVAFYGTEPRDLFRQLIEDGVTSMKYGPTSLKSSREPNTGDVTLHNTEKYIKDMKFTLDQMGLDRASVIGHGGHMQPNDDSYRFLDTEPGTDDFRKAVDAWLKRMRTFYRAHGWGDRMIWKIADEINEPQPQAPMADAAARADIIWPELNVQLTAHTLTRDLKKYLDIWVVPWHLFHAGTDDISVWDRQRERGTNMWAYQNSLYLINADWTLSANRFYPTVLAKYGFEGSLWWSVKSGYRNNPWDEIPPAKGYGQGLLFYPPRNDGDDWHPSLRWESYIQGRDEYEMMTMLHDTVAAVRKQIDPEAAFVNLSPDAQVRWWGSMLSRKFRLQTYRRDDGYIHRFRQLLAHELDALTKKPPALVHCKPDPAMAVQQKQLQVRGVAESGTRVEVAGEQVSGGEDNRVFAFSHNVSLQPGRNLVPITFTSKKGHTKTLYREVFHKR